MDFRDILGQKELLQSLRQAVENNRTSHAYIFSGSAGIGKRTIAKLFAGLLVCAMPNALSPCGECQPCMLFRNGSNPDFRMIQKDGQTIGVDEIREIQMDVSIKPLYSRHKVYIIECSDKMTTQAQNCLLKTLEEPPSYVVLILTAVNHEALLDTLRSRSLRLNFRKNTSNEVKEALVRKYGIGAEGIEFATAYSDGIIGKAYELMESDIFKPTREKAIDMLLGLKSSGLSNVFKSYSFFEEYKDDIDMVLEIMTMFLRDMLVVKRTGNEKILINSDKKDIIFSNAGKYTVEQLVAGIEHIEAAGRYIKQNANYQLAIENMLIKLQEGYI